MIIDVRCTNKACEQVREVLTQFEGESPACTACGSPSERIYTVARKGDDVSANHGSVLFQFNYPEPMS